MVTGNILDPIEASLDPDVFDDPDGVRPSLKPTIEKFVMDKIYETLKTAGYPNPRSWLRLILTGSLTTYQWGPESDFDISLWVNWSMLPPALNSRSMLVKLMIEKCDGTTPPGITHPMQDFVVGRDTTIDQLYQPGLRSALDLQTNTWLVPPERGRVHDIRAERPMEFHHAAMVLDKMKLMLAEHPGAAIQMWHRIHAKRHDDMGAGLGDFAQSNLDYKMLFNTPGVIPQIAGISGEYIAKTAAVDVGCWNCHRFFPMDQKTDTCPHCDAYQYVRGVGAAAIPKGLRSWMAQNHQRAYVDVGTHDAYRKWDLEPDLFHAVQGTSSPGMQSVHVMSHPDAKPEWTQAALLHEVGHNLQYAEDWNKAAEMSDYEREGDAHERGKKLAAQTGIEWTDAHDIASRYAHGTYADPDQLEKHWQSSKEACPVCGSSTWQPGPQGSLLHRFQVGEQIHTEAMNGVVTKDKIRHNGYMIRWENGHEGRLPNTALMMHGPMEKKETRKMGQWDKLVKQADASPYQACPGCGKETAWSLVDDNPYCTNCIRAGKPDRDKAKQFMDDHIKVIPVGMPPRGAKIADVDAWANDARQATPELAERKLHEGSWTPPQYEAYMHAWAHGAVRYSPIGDNFKSEPDDPEVLDLVQKLDPNHHHADDSATHFATENDRYVLGESPCKTCGSTGRDPQDRTRACAACGGSGREPVCPTCGSSDVAPAGETSIGEPLMRCSQCYTQDFAKHFASKTANLINDIIAKHRDAIAGNGPNGAISQDKLDALEENLAITPSEHREFQNTQAWAHSAGIIQPEEAQVIYNSLGEVHNPSNGGWKAGTDLATKSGVTTLMGSLLGAKIKQMRGAKEAKTYCPGGPLCDHASGLCMLVETGQVPNFSDVSEDPKDSDDPETDRRVQEVLQDRANEAEYQRNASKTAEDHSVSGTDEDLKCQYCGGNHHYTDCPKAPDRNWYGDDYDNPASPMQDHKSKIADITPADWTEWKNQPEILVDHWNHDHTIDIHDRNTSETPDQSFAELISQHNEDHERRGDQLGHTHGRITSIEASNWTHDGQRIDDGDLPFARAAAEPEEPSEEWACTVCGEPLRDEFDRNGADGHQHIWRPKTAAFFDRIGAGDRPVLVQEDQDEVEIFLGL